MKRPTTSLWVAIVALALGACDNPPPADLDASVPSPRIHEVAAPTPILIGSVLTVRGVSFDRFAESAQLLVAAEGRDYTFERLPHTVPGELLFEVGADFVGDVGPGFVDAVLRVSDGSLTSSSHDATWELATSLEVSLTAAPSGDAHRNDVVVLRGAGFHSATEGELSLHFEGMFVRDAGGASAPIDVRLPVDLAERSARDRGIVVLTTELGGVWPGVFTGTVRLESTLRGGSTSMSDAMPSSLRFLRPELFSLAPTEGSVGQVVTVRGAGFLGGASRPDETTVLRIEGSFTPSGGSAGPFGPAELVPRFESGSEVGLVIETAVRDAQIISAAFGAARGVFMGTATPIVIDGRDEVSGDPVPFRFVLGPLVQVVWLRFLPGYFDSLARFGLSSAADEVARGIEHRIEEIYAGYNVDVRLEEPSDFDASAYGIVEIGGPDPNGRGLFGYDNSPGKDIGNLRLFDAIGGANAETQADGYPGYGGVFVESLLWWSSHPDLPGGSPTSSPEPDPLFDEIFDATRLRPATLAEARGEGDAARVAQVRRAIDGLASIVGETTAHELGHSFGLAQPYGSATAFHNELDGDGCLMDRGSDRPLAERAAQPGAARTILCEDAPMYMSEILGL